MVEITMQISESLAREIQSYGDWSSTIVELRLADFQFPSVRGVSAELIDFLSHNPSPKEISDYFISDKHQKRLGDLLEWNREGEAMEKHQKELDEWEKFEHISILMKTKARKLLKEGM